jgi:hypothetical protein
MWLVTRQDFIIISLFGRSHKELEALKAIKSTTQEDKGNRRL